MKPSGLGLLAALLGVVAGSTSAQAAEPAPPPATPGVVIGGHNFIHSVADLDRTLAFYREVFKLEADKPPGKPAAIAAIQALTDSSGAAFRATALKIPGAGFELELTEFSGVALHPAHPKVQDPGASMLALIVRDIEGVAERARRQGAEVITTGGKPIHQGGEGAPGSRALFLRDPDGAAIEVLQMDQPPASPPAGTPPAGEVVLSGGFGQTVADLDRSARFWKHFGVELAAPPAKPGAAATMAISATENASFRAAPARIPGTSFSWIVLEFGGIERTPLQRAVRDPGAPAISLAVRDLDEAIAAAKQAGAAFISRDNQPLRGPDGRSGSIFMRDPDGFPFELIQSALAPAKRAD